MQVKGLMNPNVVCVQPDCPVALAARLLSRHNVGALPVCSEEGMLQGIVTDRDIVVRCVAPGEDPQLTTVGDIMTRRPATAHPESDCALLSRQMARQQVRRLPVVDGGNVVGMISLGDLARSRTHDMEAARALSEISENIIRR